MINAFKTVRSLPSTTVSFFSPPSRFACKVTRVSFATASDQQKMDKNPEKPEKPNEKHGDVMSHSYGEGYWTRCDEEGFGGTYGGNQTLQKDNEIHENHLDYDKIQGSEAKEKEKARNQAH